MPGMKKMMMMKKGGKAKKKSKFPDHSGDGKITKKDILMAKGIIPFAIKISFLVILPSPE